MNNMLKNNHEPPMHSNLGTPSYGTKIPWHHPVDHKIMSKTLNSQNRPKKAIFGGFWVLDF